MIWWTIIAKSFQVWGVWHIPQCLHEFDSVGRYLVYYLKLEKDVDKIISSIWKIQFTKDHCADRKDRLKGTSHQGKDVS